MRSGGRALGLLCLSTAAGCLPGGTAPAPRTDDVATLRHVIDSVLAAPETRHARWGVLIVDPDRGDTLYSRDADKLFVPASNMKIVTSAVALAQLGPDFQFATPLLATGPVRDSILVGDLVIVGRGDPSISDNISGDAMLPLQSVAEALSTRGIRRVAGTVRAVGDAFSDANFGFGWAWDDLDYAYSAPVDDLLFNEGFSLVHLRGGAAVGDSVTVWTSPARTFPTIRVRVTTDSGVSGPDSASRVDAVKDTLTGVVELVGHVLPGDSVTLAVTHTDPQQAFVAALREALRDQGIVIGDSAFAADSAAAALDTLHVLQSPPLGQILGFFMKPSQNQVGEMLFKSVALQATDTGTARVGRRIVREQLLAWGADSAGFTVFDGSGLSRRNMLTPATIVDVLHAMRRGPHFQSYYDAFPVAGVDGTLRTRMRGTIAEGNVRAKTGTLGSVRSLSGYVTTAEGQQLLFSVLANNYLVSTDYISRVQDTIAVRLARLRGRPPLGDVPLTPAVRSSPR